VLVELFTSEGCSSCPPAEAVLRRLVREQPVAGARVIALAEHVDYWNDLGWADPFSSPLFTRRQREYATRLERGRVYTPQLVVAGETHLVGSDERAAVAAIAAAARRSKGEVSLRLLPGMAPAVEVAARWPDGATAEVFLATVKDRATSEVTRGENAGRTLEHVAVARAIDRIGSGKGSFTGRAAVPADPEASSVVVFVQERGGRVHAAAALELAR
jgi:hypothetical protein